MRYLTEEKILQIFLIRLLLEMLPVIIDLISDPLCHTINLSTRSGVVPDQFKIARVIPIFKNGDKHIFQ